ncbi:MAG: hypothetical protein ACK41P_07095 [Asticcacaulis sp.]
MTINRPMLKVTSALTLLAVAATLKLVQSQGFIQEDAITRLTQIAIGLSLVFLANTVPKRIGRARASLVAEGRAQTAKRIAGWSMVLGGLTYAATWALAPMALAAPIAMAAVALGLCVAAVFALKACQSMDADRVT